MCNLINDLLGIINFCNLRILGKDALLGSLIGKSVQGGVVLECNMKLNHH